MNINKKELKVISYDFRCISNRVLNANYAEAVSILKMFINHIEGNNIIFDFIKSNITIESDIEGDMQTICSSHGATFGTGETPQDEIAYTYKLLKYIVEEQISYTRFTSGYANSTHYQDRVKGFNNRVVLPFINYIEGYLTRISIKMGYDEEVKHMITISGTNGQVNISQDNSNLNAVQNQGVNAKELEQLIRAIKESLPGDMENLERDIIIDNVDCLQEQLQNQNPKKGLIKTCITGLKSAIQKIPSSIDLCVKINELIEHVQQNIPD